MINLNNSQVYYKPYPYILFKDVFDDNFYKSLCSEFPHADELVKLDFDEKRNQHKQDKFYLTDLNKSFSKLISSKKNTANLYNFLKSHFFLNHLINFLNKNNLRIFSRLLYPRFGVINTVVENNPHVKYFYDIICKDIDCIDFDMKPYGIEDKITYKKKFKNKK
jgi:hypothetical protein